MGSVELDTHACSRSENATVKPHAFDTEVSSEECARLGSNQRPLACESRSAVAVSRHEALIWLNHAVHGASSKPGLGLLRHGYLARISHEFSSFRTHVIIHELVHLKVPWLATGAV